MISIKKFNTAPNTPYRTKEKVISDIVKTYDLPSRFESKLIRIATKNVDEFFIDGFDNIYEYVGQLVDRFKIPFGERAALGLDRPINHGSKNPFHDLFGTEDPNLIDLLEEPSEKTSVDKAINILGNVLSKFDLQLLKQLVNQRRGNNGNNLLNASPEEIIANAETIQHRLKELAHKYERDGRLIIPKRRIRHVQFNPLTIKYTHRLSQREIDIIIAAHKTYNANASETARHLPYTLRTILTYWKNKELKIKKPGQEPLNQSRIDEIIAAHLIYNGNASEAARHLPYSKSSVWRYWKATGLETKTKNSHLSQEQINKIIAAHPIYNGNASETARHLPYPLRTILTYWKNKELKIKKPGQEPLNQSRIDEIIAAHPIYNGNASKAARHLPYSKNTVLKHWKATGLETKTKNSHLSQEQINKIIAAHPIYNGNALEAARHLPYSKSSVWRHWKAARLKCKGHLRGG